MMKMPLHRWALLGLALLPIAVGGCVERRFVITSDVPDTVVLDWKGEPRGTTTADIPFVYYAKYQFTLMKEGYEILTVTENVKAPWYEVFGLDFVSECLVPWNIPDVRRIDCNMKKLQAVSEKDLVKRAGEMQTEGRSIVVPHATDQPRPAPDNIPLVSPPGVGPGPPPRNPLLPPGG